MMIDEKLKEYHERFKEGFPTYMFTESYDQQIEVIDRCLKAGKTVYELGLVDEDDDVMY